MTGFVPVLGHGGSMYPFSHVLTLALFTNFERLCRLESEHKLTILSTIAFVLSLNSQHPPISSLLSRLLHPRGLYSLQDLLIIRQWIRSLR
jgi:hypothetical protein